MVIKGSHKIIVTLAGTPNTRVMRRCLANQITNQFF